MSALEMAVVPMPQRPRKPQPPAPKKKKQKKKKQPKLVNMALVSNSPRAQLDAATRKSLFNQIKGSMKVDALAMRRLKLKILNKIINSITLPGQTEPVRFCSSLSTQETALGQPFQQWKYPWSGTTTYTPTAERTMGANTGLIFIFRDYLRHIVFYDPNVAGGSIDGSFVMTSTDTYMSEVVPSVVTDINLTKLELVNVPVQYVNYLGNYKPHGPTQYAGNPSGKPGDAAGQFIWCQAGERITFTTTPTGNTTLEFYGDQWTPHGVIKGSAAAVSVAMTGGLQYITNMDILKPGYYSFWISSTADTDCVLSIEVTTVTVSEYWCHRTIGSFEANGPSCENVKVLASSILYTNTAAAAYRSGNFVDVQLPAGKSWLTNITAAGYDNFASQAKVDEKSVIEGMYMYLKPTQVEDFRALKYHTNYLGFFQASHYPLNQEDDYLAIWYNIEQNTTNNSQGANCVAYSNVEYSSTNSWIGQACPDINHDLYLEALQMVRHMPQTFLNSNHMKELYNRVKEFFGGVLEGVKAYGPEFINGVAKYGPQVVGAATTVASLL